MEDQDQDYRRRKDDYEAGKRAAQIEALQDGVLAIRHSLTEHRQEEKDIWERFERKLQEVETAIQDLKTWRAKMMGVAGIVAFAITTVWSFVLAQIKGR